MAFWTVFKPDEDTAFYLPANLRPSAVPFLKLRDRIPAIEPVY